jgi:outer membrane protein insertion porin family
VYQVFNDGRVRLFLLILPFCLFIYSTTLLAQQGLPQSKQYKILGISVEGNKASDAAAIIANSALKIGDELTIPGEQTRTAITQLWKLRIFSDIRIETAEENKFDERADHLSPGNQ